MVDKTATFTEEGFYDAILKLFNPDRVGLAPEAIAKSLSFDDCVLMYAYYFDIVTRDSESKAINAWGAGFLAYNMIRNDLKNLNDPNCVSTAKLCSTASLVLYDKAVNERGWNEYTARRLLIRDAFYLYPQRLGHNRLMNGALESNFWSDAVILTDGEDGWERVLSDGYELSDKDQILTPKQLVQWWKDTVHETNGDDYFLATDIIHCLMKKMANWKVICVIGFLVKNKIISKDAGYKAYAMVLDEYEKMRASDKKNNIKHDHDSTEKLVEYATYFELRASTDVPTGYDIERALWKGASYKEGYLFDDKEGANPKKESMKDKIAARKKSKNIVKGRV